MTSKAGRDRRRHDRYSLNDRIFLAFRPHFEKLGLLKDISTDGAAFEYTTCDRPEECETLNIEVEIFSHETFRVSRIPCRVVYDTTIEQSSIVTGFETRRCGLQFGRLSEVQTSQLRVLMQTHVGDLSLQI